LLSPTATKLVKRLKYTCESVMQHHIR